MSISLSNILFSTNAGSAMIPTTVTQKTQSVDQSKDSSIFAGVETVDAQTSEQNTSTDETSNNVETTYTKNIDNKKTSEKTSTDENPQEDNETDETTSETQDASTVVAIPNISIDTNIDNTSIDQPLTSESSVRVLTELNTTQNPVISQTAQEIDIQEFINPQQEQSAEIIDNTLPSEKSLIGQNSENQELIANSGIPQTEDSEIVQSSEVIEAQTENQISISATAEQSEEIQPELTIGDIEAGSDQSSNIASVSDKEIPKVEVSNFKTVDNTTENIEAPVQPIKDTAQNSNNNLEQNTSENNTKNSVQNGDSVDDNTFNSDNLSIDSEQQTSQTQQSAGILENASDEASSSETSVSDIDINSDSLLGNFQSAITENAQTLKTSANTSKTDSASSVGTQIQDSIQTSLSADNKQIVIQLNPPELGKVEVKFTEDSTGLTGVLSVDKLQTKNEIQRSLPEIVQNLQDSGVNIKKIEVVLSNQQEQQTMKDQSSMAGQNNWFAQQQQNSSNQQTYGSSNIYNQWTAGSSQTEYQASEYQMQYSEDYVNMLA